MQTRNGLQEVAELQGALFCCFQGALAQTRGEKEKKKKMKKNKEGDSTLSQAVPPRRLRTENFSYKNKIKKPHKTHQTPRKHTKRLFDFGFFLLVGLVYFPWVGGFWI